MLERRVAGAPSQKENPRNTYAAPARGRPATLDRGSSRRIPVMRHQPANVSLIHRRCPGRPPPDARDIQRQPARTLTFCSMSGVGVENGTSPGITAQGESYDVAFQANGSRSGELWVYTPATGALALGLGVEKGTSPAITTRSGGSYDIAFQANGIHSGELWTYTPSGGGIPNSFGMSLGSSPSATNG